MKKLLTLVLCWLLAFSAIAETTFKAKTAASVAGGYVTSLNKVDGSFEDGSTQWSASVGTIVPTASTEFQGNKYGLWSGTGAGTLDLQWTATASNTYEASAQVDVQGEDDVYVCAYVGTTETGCKLIPALSKINKVSVVADSVISSAFYLRLKHTGSDAFNVKVDDGKIEPFTFPTAALNVQEGYNAVYTSYAASTVSGLPYKLNFASSATSTINSLLSYSTTTMRFTALKSSRITLAATVGCTLDVDLMVKRVTDGMQYAKLVPGGATLTSLYRLQGSKSFDIAAGESFEIGTSGDFGTMLPSSNISITASAISENVVQSYTTSDFLGEIKLLPRTTAPKGFIPADGKSIGKTSGDYQGDAYYALYALRWAMASTTAGEPYVISSAKGASAQADWDAGKTITIDVRGMFFRAAGGNAGAVGSKQLDAFQGHQHTAISIMLGTAIAPGTSYGDGGSQTTSSIVTDGTNGTPRIASETRPINTSEYAYMRYGTSAPDLYALPTRSEVFSANVAAAGTVTNATQNFVTSCTNATPSVCSLWSNFGVTPICWAHTTDITKRAEVSASTATTATVARTDTSTAFNLFCHLK